MDISVLIPALNETENLKLLLPLIKQTLKPLMVDYEIIIMESEKGFGSALRDGFKVAKGDFIITMDADLSHQPEFIKNMWEKRAEAELIIASRYVKGGLADMGGLRYLLSRTLNKTFSFILSLDIKDMSSNFRMYRKRALDSVQTCNKNFDILPEILLKIYCEGWKIKEMPFHYRPRRAGHSHAKLLRFGRDYITTLFRMWQLRNSIYCADYDFRAFYSKIFLQRFWQRQRYRKILNFIDKKDSFLDIGCGSSKIIIDNPEAIALDISLGKLRYLRATNKNLVNADASRLPFKDSAFNCVVCSQVIEHIKGAKIFDELYKVLAKNGILVIGTPDYGKLTWRFIEYVYSIIHRGGYADKHITHYTYRILKDILENVGFKILDSIYICNSELIIKAQKV